MNTNLGNRIKNLRNERHFSQEYVAEQIGVSRQSVSKWESEASRPSTGNLLCLAELFDVSLDAFTQETSDTSDNGKKRKVSKILKIIACVAFGICILHFIIWAIIYGIYSLRGDAFAENISAFLTVFSVIGTACYALLPTAGVLASAGIAIVGAIDKSKKTVLTGIILICAMLLLRLLPLMYMHMQIVY